MNEYQSFMDISRARLSNNYDILRLLAALCIAFTHSFNLLSQNSREPLMLLSNQQFDFSYIGLCIFFSVSGYLVVKSAVTSINPLNYYWKRFLRIQPLLILVTILSIIAVGPIFTTMPLTAYFKDLFTFTYLRNIFPATGIQFILPGVFANNKAEAGVNGSLWTLVVEERLYILVSVLCFLKFNSQKYFVFPVIILDIIYISQNVILHLSALHYFAEPHIFYALLFLNAGGFFLMNLDFKKLARPKFFAPMFLLVILLLVFPSLAVLRVLVIPLFIITLAQWKGVLNKAGTYGDFTYGLYLFAFPVQQMLIAGLNGDNPWILFGQTLLVVTPLAILSWHLVEKRFLKLKGVLK